MIDLLAPEDRSGFGIAAALAIEGIPFRRIARPEEFDAHLLVMGGAPTPAAVALTARVPTLAIGPCAPLARAVFGVSGGRLTEEPASLSLDEPIWPAPVRAMARHFEQDALRLPSAPRLVPEAAPAGTLLAQLQGAAGRVQTAVVRLGEVSWCLVDLGAAFANLLDESYLPAPRLSGPRPMPFAALAAYYRAPEFLRAILQRRVYARLGRRLAAHACASDYPVDAAGWLLLELLKGLVRSAAGCLVRLARWPAPHGAAAVLTHDLEPSRFAYTRGLERLKADVARNEYPPTIGVVSRAATRHLPKELAEWVGCREVLCHGLEHRGETIRGAREDIARGLVAAREELAARLGRPIAGFRSPRLDRSADLLWALDRTGFRYDSSYPDVDRETVSRFGAGVRLNVPFRPPIDDGGHRVRASRCLELPVSAPDCIQPLFAGDDVAALRRAVDRKIRFVRATGGLYTGIVHAGVFGRRDTEQRSAHLDFVRHRLRGADLWLAGTSEIVDWWCARERVAIAWRDGRIQVTNGAERVVEGARLVLDRGDGETVHALPPLGPGGSTIVAAERLSPPRTAAPQAARA